MTDDKSPEGLRGPGLFVTYHWSFVIDHFDPGRSFLCGPLRLRAFVVKGLFGRDFTQVRDVAENNDGQRTAGEEPGLQVSPDKYKHGDDKHGRERSDGSFLRPAPSAAEHAKRGIEHQAGDRDPPGGLEKEQYPYHRRDPLATVEFQEGAPAVSH